ncbi:very long chain fatty acid elongase 7 isoform X2 [Cloeon dipterum]|uniref:very long chain fatty acid elongase 7 isoform X2 n=1 Tax=Cloeon dipterum TaxID=197152 RepID=UPI003220676B
MDLQSCSAGNLSECLQPTPQTLGGLQDAPEAGFVGAAKRYWHLVFTELADPRTNDWLLISSPLPGLTIIACYLIFCLKVGPKFMENRKPFQLKNTLIVYNALQVYASVWLFWEACEGAWLSTYSWRCQPVDPSTSPEAMRVARGVWIYFILKITELLDTVFFVLRKKQNQISFLHLYHHTVMPMISWGCTKYYPGGHGTFIGFINTFVHIIMYAYYLLSALGPQLQKYLWWKKYITRMQMAQFCMAFLHNTQLLFYDCGFPRWTAFLTLPNAIFFYYLFNDFYQQAYKEKQARLKAASDAAAALAKNGAAKANGKTRLKAE